MKRPDLNEGLQRSKHTSAPLLFDDDDDDDEEEGVAATLAESTKTTTDTAAPEAASALTPKTGSWSRFDDDDDDAVEEEGNDGHDLVDSDDSTIVPTEESSSKAVLITLVHDLRREIAELRSEMAFLKGESLEAFEPPAAPEDVDAITLGKAGQRPKPPQPVQNSADWERLASEENARRHAKRGVQRRSKRPLPPPARGAAGSKESTTIPVAVQPATAATRLATSPPKHVPVSGKVAHQTRRDSFFDASSDSSSDSGPDAGGRDSFAWDDDSNDGSSDEQVPHEEGQQYQQQRQHQAASVEHAGANQPNLSADDGDKLRMDVEAATLTWARGKDIVSMLASINLVFTGDLSFRLPPAWTWTGSGVQDRAAIHPSEIRKAYLRVVRQVHPDKQSNCALLVKMQANAVFTALSDAYAAAQLSP